MTPRRSALAILFVIVFIDLLGFGMVIPVIPLYAERLGASVEATGWLLTGYSAMQFVFTPIWGRLSDRYGRRPLLLASIGMTGVAFLGYALAPSFAWLLASRLFAGAATANIAIAQAYIADVTAPEERARGMGLIGAAFGLGFVLGPGIGGLLSGSGTFVALPGLVAAGLAFANGLAALAFLPEPGQRAERPHRASLRALAEELGRPGIRRLITIFFLSMAAFSAMEATFALLAAHRHGLDQRQVNWVFAFFGLLAVVVQGGLIGRLTARYGEGRLLVTGLVLQTVAFVALPWTPGVIGLYAACVPLAVGSGLATPSLNALLSRSARDEDQGGTLGMGQSASALGRILGPISATHAFGRLGVAAPYLAGAALLFLSAGIGSTLLGAAGTSAARRTT